MPELPDLVVYLEQLAKRISGQPLVRIRLLSPFLLRSALPPIDLATGRRVVGLKRLGKRIVIGLDGDYFLVLHLMVAGRLRWQEPGRKPPTRISQAIFEFPSGQLIFTEAGSKRLASLHFVAGEAMLNALDPGGVEPLDCDFDTFRTRLIAGNHTLKRALTDPKTFAGMGNAYSDEIFHRARLSPLALTQRLSPSEIERLYRAVRTVLAEWTDTLRQAAGDAFPEGVTAFRPGMAVHGRFGLPCPDCGAPVQRIVYADNETNYCARCQTGGKVLADRSLSRLLKDAWPRSIDGLA